MNSVLEMRDRMEVAGGFGHVDRVAAVSGTFGDVAHWRRPSREMPRRRRGPAAGCVLIVLSGSNSTRFGLSTTRLPLTFSAVRRQNLAHRGVEALVVLRRADDRHLGGRQRHVLIATGEARAPLPPPRPAIRVV